MISGKRPDYAISQCKQNRGNVVDNGKKGSGRGDGHLSREIGQRRLESDFRSRFAKTRKHGQSSPCMGRPLERKREEKRCLSCFSAMREGDRRRSRRERRRRVLLCAHLVMRPDVIRKSKSQQQKRIWQEREIIRLSSGPRPRFKKREQCGRDRRAARCTMRQRAETERKRKDSSIPSSSSKAMIIKGKEEPRALQGASILLSWGRKKNSKIGKSRQPWR